MIATRTEIKTLLQITDTTKDALIDALIPICQEEIIGYCNSHFASTIYNSDEEEYTGSNTISFVASTKTISDSSSLFPFSSGQDVYITGSKYNYGHYSIVTATTSNLIVSETLIDEAAGNNVNIKLVIWPKSLKVTMADMINYKILGKDAGVTGESISGAMSYNFSAELGSFPLSLLAGLNKYRVVGLR